MSGGHSAGWRACQLGVQEAGGAWRLGVQGLGVQGGWGAGRLGCMEAAVPWTVSPKEEPTNPKW